VKVTQDWLRAEHKHKRGGKYSPHWRRESESSKAGKSPAEKYPKVRVPEEEPGKASRGLKDAGEPGQIPLGKFAGGNPEKKESRLENYTN